MVETTVNVERGARTRKRRHRSVAAVLITALLLFSVSAGLTYSFLPHQPGAATTVQPQQGAVGQQPTGPNFKGINILLLGVDERPGDYGRSDTMMLLSIDPDNNRAHLMSIPRDTMVTLPGHGTQKINAAYAFGGPKMAKQAVADLTGLPINYYVRVNLQGFVGIVDLLGGVDINVPEKMDYDDPTPGQDLHIHLKPGMQHMDGKTALGFVRFRGDWQADLGRIQRQQEFLKAIGEQVVTPSIVTKLPSLISQTAKMVSTDIPLTDRLSLAMTAYRAYGNGLDTSTLPGEAKYIDNISYVVVDQSKLQAQIESWTKQ